MGKAMKFHSCETCSGDGGWLDSDKVWVDCPNCGGEGGHHVEVPVRRHQEHRTIKRGRTGMRT